MSSPRPLLPVPTALGLPDDAAWRALADLSSDMLALLDERGCIAWVNEAFVRTSGLAASLATDQPLASLIGFAGIPGPWNAIAQALASGQPVPAQELAWQHPSGDTRWGRLSACCLPGNGTPGGLLVALQDLSELHRLTGLPLALREVDHVNARDRQILGPVDMGHDTATPNVQRLHSLGDGENPPPVQPDVGMDLMADDTETHEFAQAFNDTSEQLRLAVDLGNIAIWRQDLQTKRFHYNYRAYEVLDIAPRPEGLSQDEVRALIHPDDLPRVIAGNSTALDSDRPVDLEARYRRADGSWRNVLTRRVLRRDAAGEPMEFMGVALDVTDRVRTEAALRSANERVALTARSVGLGIWEWNPNTDTSTWDDQMYRLRGIEPVGTPPNAKGRRQMVHAEDQDRVDRLLAEAVARRKSAAYEFRVIWPDGSVHWLASRSTPIAGPDSGSLHYIGVNWDITDSVNAEAARRERFVAQRESEAKSQFLARMSHELRTPLNAVLGFAQLLQLDSDTADTEQCMRIEHILSAGEHLLSLINDVLDLSSLESGQIKLDMQAVPLAELVSEALPLVTPLAQSFKVKVECDAMDGVAWADRFRLRQVLVNLMSNAIKYNRPGGMARVGMELRQGDVVLTVTDTGRGLTPEQCAHLFEPFNRLGIEHEGIEGTGIGLTIVKTLLGRMGGSIDVRSVPGTGSTFSVKLQRADHPSAVVHKKPAVSMGATRTSTATLLYIEDNPINVMLMHELVTSRHGWTLVSEVDGTRGVARAAELMPDIVLVDMQLPDFDGFEVLRQLSADPRTSRLPCVAVSANAMPDDVSRALAAGFIEYWTKPINFAAFLKSLESRLSSLQQE